MTNKGAFVKAVSDRAQQLIVAQYEAHGTFNIMECIEQATNEVTTAATLWLKQQAEHAEDN